jgi:hypothetical protein
LTVPFVLLSLVLSHGRLFCELFPEMVDLHTKQVEQEAARSTAGGGGNATAGAAAVAGSAVAARSMSASSVDGGESASWTAIVGVLAAIVACTWAILALAL